MTTRLCYSKSYFSMPPPLTCQLSQALPLRFDLSAFRSKHAKTLDFESLVKVKFKRDLPHFLGKDQAWSELQLVNFIQ